MKTKYWRLLPVICLAFQAHAQQLPDWENPVSYTHLTLPTT